MSRMETGYIIVGVAFGFMIGVACASFIATSSDHARLAKQICTERQMTYSTNKDMCTDGKSYFELTNGEVK